MGEGFFPGLRPPETPRCLLATAGSCGAPKPSSERSGQQRSPAGRVLLVAGLRSPQFQSPTTPWQEPEHPPSFTQREAAGDIEGAEPAATPPPWCPPSRRRVPELEGLDEVGDGFMMSPALSPHCSTHDTSRSVLPSPPNPSARSSSSSRTKRRPVASRCWSTKHPGGLSLGQRAGTGGKEMPRWAQGMASPPSAWQMVSFPLELVASKCK